MLLSQSERIVGVSEQLGLSRTQMAPGTIPGQEVFATLPADRLTWAIGAIHSEVDRLVSLHDRLAMQISPRDNLVYLGNFLGLGRHVIATVQEMLLFSGPGFVSLLPALPDRWERGSISGLRCRGGATVDIHWWCNSLKALLLSDSDQKVTMKCPKRIISIRPDQGDPAGLCLHLMVKSEKEVEDLKRVASS